MHIESSVTSVSWIPSESMPGPLKVAAGGWALAATGLPARRINGQTWL